MLYGTGIPLKQSSNTIRVQTKKKKIEHNDNGIGWHECHTSFSFGTKCCINGDPIHVAMLKHHLSLPKVNGMFPLLLLFSF